MLALIGDRYHNADYIRVALDRVWDGLGVTVDYTIDYGQLSREALKNYQLFVCLRDGMIWPDGYSGPDAYPYQQGLENRGDASEPKSRNWLKEEQALALKDFVTAGNGFYSLHNNSHVSLSSKTYREVMGGAYIGHPELRPFKVRVVNNSHPITQGVHDFVVTDEQHYVEYDKDRKNILLEAENIDGLTFRESRHEIHFRMGVRIRTRARRLHRRRPHDSRAVESRIREATEARSSMAAERDLIVDAGRAGAAARAG